MVYPFLDGITDPATTTTNPYPYMDQDKRPFVYFVKCPSIIYLMDAFEQFGYAKILKEIDIASVANQTDQPLITKRIIINDATSTTMPYQPLIPSAPVILPYQPLINH